MNRRRKPKIQLRVPPIPKFDLEEALSTIFKLLNIYGLSPYEIKESSKCLKIFWTIFSNFIDIVCLLPYVIYSLSVTDPYYTERASAIYWYFLKINLFTFGLSRLAVRNNSVKFKEIRDRLTKFKVELETLNKTKSYSRRILIFITFSVSLSIFAALALVIYAFVIERHVTFQRKIFILIYFFLTSLFTGICLFGFTCTAFAFVCIVSLWHNLRRAALNVVQLDAPLPYIFQEFQTFTNIHIETQAIIEQIDSVFTRIPFVIILTQISSVSMIFRLPFCTYGIIDEKIVAVSACIANFAMYVIVLLWIVAASKLNHELHRSGHVLCHLLVKHKDFMEPIWVKRHVINFLIHMTHLKMKQAGIRIGGLSLVEAFDSARVSIAHNNIILFFIIVRK
ncbi:hypothetical protein CHUAL_002485 [Chamberlinius hualienensis]